MRPDFQCQFPFDGHNNEGIKLLYLPYPGEAEQDMGRYLSYSWDKYTFDDNLNCVYDYHGKFGSLEGVVWDITNKVVGEVCAFNLYFNSANCGNGCDEEDLFVGLYTF